VSATKKTPKTMRTTRKATTRKASTARRTTTGRRTTRRTTTRRTTRRARPKVATTIGAGLATLAVAAFAGASWPVRIALVLAALVLVGGYLLVQGRRHDAAEAATAPTAVADQPADDTGQPETTGQPSAAPQPPAAPHTDTAPPAEPRPEDPA
jgi:hypothetical protein